MRCTDKAGPNLWLLAGMLMAVVGCAVGVSKQTAQHHAAMAPAHPYYDYACFVLSNLAAIDHIYSKEYGPWEFVVDTDDGSASVQSLLAPVIALEVPPVLALKDNECHPAQKIYTYIQSHFTYVTEPQPWQPAEETFRLGQGDCKNLSLLLMSLLVAFDIDVFAAISGGHMWVNVHYEGQWRVFELDPDPARRSVYQLPGFYERPLYKVYAERTFKRLKRGQ